MQLIAAMKAISASGTACWMASCAWPSTVRALMAGARTFSPDCNERHRHHALKAAHRFIATTHNGLSRPLWVDLDNRRHKAK